MHQKEPCVAALSKIVQSRMHFFSGFISSGLVRTYLEVKALKVESAIYHEAITEATFIK